MYTAAWKRESKGADGIYAVPTPNMKYMLVGTRSIESVLYHVIWWRYQHVAPLQQFSVAASSNKVFTLGEVD